MQVMYSSAVLYGGVAGSRVVDSTYYVLLTSCPSLFGCPQASHPQSQQQQEQQQHQTSTTNCLNLAGDCQDPTLSSLRFSLPRFHSSQPTNPKRRRSAISSAVQRGAVHTRYLAALYLPPARPYLDWNPAILRTPSTYTTIGT